MNAERFRQGLKNAIERRAQNKTATTTSAKQSKPKVTDEQYCKLITDKALIRIKERSRMNESQTI